MKKLFENLKPCMYKYNNKIAGLETEKFTMGVMAQDIRKGIDESGYDPDEFSIIKMNDNGYYSVDYIQLIPILISKIRELEKDINKLKEINERG